jgi:uncharacterized membrane protein YhaH (DUF805 family)
MGFLAAVRACLGRYATFSGRARRPEYWWFVLFTVLAGIAASLIDAALTGVAAGQGPVSTVAGLALLPPTLAVSWRRLHDVGRSGWFIVAPQVASVATAFLVLAMSASMEWQTGATPVIFQILAALGGIATLVSFILVFVWLVSRSQTGPNRFGPEPAA